MAGRIHAQPANHTPVAPDLNKRMWRCQCCTLMADLTGQRAHPTSHIVTVAITKCHTCFSALGCGSTAAVGGQLLRGWTKLFTGCPWQKIQPLGNTWHVS
jgi:hypothetical protein